MANNSSDNKQKQEQQKEGEDASQSENTNNNKKKKKQEQQIYQPITPSLAQDHLKRLGEFSKNFLPLFFNVFGSATEDQRVYLRKTIKTFLSITEQKVCLHIYGWSFQTADDDSIEWHYLANYLSLFSMLLLFLLAPEYFLQKLDNQVIGSNHKTSAR